MSTSLQLAKNFLHKTVTITVGRKLGTKHPKHGFEYQLNYGFIQGVKAPDGEDLDAYVIGVEESVDTFKGMCIAIIHRKDDDDDKLVVAPVGENYTNSEILEMTHFQEQWFDSEILR